MTLSEYQEAVEERAQQVFDSAKSRQLSTVYSNESLARLFAELASKSGAKNLEIMRREKSGRKRKNGTEVLHWVKV